MALPKLMRAHAGGEAELIPGTLYCWDLSSQQEPAAEYMAEEGQLVWRTLDGVRPYLKLAFALVDDGNQRRLEHVQGLDGRFVRLVVNEKSGSRETRVSFDELIEAIHASTGPREWVRVERD